MPYCSECGTKNDEGARFCESCGKTLTDAHLITGIISGNKAYPACGTSLL